MYRIKYDIETLTLYGIACCLLTSLINKLTDWRPNYHKTARMFRRTSWIPHSMNKLTLNEPAKINLNRPLTRPVSDWIY